MLPSPSSCEGGSRAALTPASVLPPRENDITPVLDHTFCVEHNAFGRILQHELKPNGRNVPVTEENKKEYVR